jgi:hypothetical protein
MSPIPVPVEIPKPDFNATEPALRKRVNLNPLHWATLPVKKNWDKVGPALNRYNDVTRIISILLGSIGMVIMLEKHHWKPPRWPWAKDGRNHPPPSFVHENERYTVDQLTERKLMELLKEMKLNEGIDGPIKAEELPPPIEEENITLKEAEEQFLGDAGEGVDDIIEEVEGVGVP